MKIRLTLLAALVMFASALLSQQPKKYKPRQFKRQPVWIEMMNDPSANYYQTLRAFREYWKSRVLPKEPMENPDYETFEKEVGLLKEGESEKEREREKNRKQGEETIKYAAEVRAFKGWMQDTKPWVRADGSIVPMAERQSVIDRQAEELREIEKKNGKK